MRTYRLLLSMMAVTVEFLFHGNAYAANEANRLELQQEITVDVGTTEVVLPILLVNVTQMTGFQCDLYLPEGFTVATDEYGDYLIDMARTTAKRHSLAAREMESGALRIVLSSMTNATFSGNSGAVLNVTLVIASSVKAGSYTVSLKNNVLTDPQAVRYTSSDVSGTIVIQGASQPVAVIAPADVTTHSGERVELSINITNEADLTVVGMGFTLALPSGVTLTLDDDGEPMYDLVSARLNPRRFAVYTDRNADGTWSFSISATTQTAKLAGTEGAALTLTVDVADGLANGAYDVMLKDNTLSVRESDNSVSTMVLNDTKGTLTVGNTEKGDVNGDGAVDVADIATIISVMAGGADDDVRARMADVNGDGAVDVADIATVISIMAASSRQQMPETR